MSGSPSDFDVAKSVAELPGKAGQGASGTRAPMGAGKPSPRRAPPAASPPVGPAVLPSPPVSAPGAGTDRTPVVDIKAFVEEKKPKSDMQFSAVRRLLLPVCGSAGSASRNDRWRDSSRRRTPCRAASPAEATHDSHECEEPGISGQVRARRIQNQYRRRESRSDDLAWRWHCAPDWRDPTQIREDQSCQVWQVPQSIGVSIYGAALCARGRMLSRVRFAK